MRRYLILLACIAVAGGTAFPRDTARGQEEHQTRFPIQHLSFCSDRTRLINLAAAAGDHKITIHATCLDDRTGQTTKAIRSAQIPAFLDSSEFHSALDPNSVAFFHSKTKVGYRASGIDINFANGRFCAGVSATTRKQLPMPRRFLPDNLDWRSSIDYMLDESCSVLIVQLGNQIAIAPISQNQTFTLYGMHFSISN